MTWIFWCLLSHQKSPVSLLHSASQMKPHDSRNAKKSVTIIYFSVKNLGLHNHCSFQHPQQLIIRFPKPKHNHLESYTNNLHLKKISPKLDFPIKKYFGQKKSKYPFVSHLSKKFIQWFDLHFPSTKVDQINAPIHNQFKQQSESKTKEIIKIHCHQKSRKKKNWVVCCLGL